MELDLYTCGDPELPETRGCGFVATFVKGRTPQGSRECPVCGGRNWHYLGTEAKGLGMPVAGVTQLHH